MDRELVCRLFVLATEILEDTHPIATKGMRSKSTPKTYNDLAQKLMKAAGDLNAAAGAVISALHSGHPRI